MPQQNYFNHPQFQTQQNWEENARLIKESPLFKGQNFYQQQNQGYQPPMSQNQVQSMSAYPETNEESKLNDDKGAFRFTERPADEIPNDFVNNNLQYSIVDMQNGFIYFVGPVTKENFPPQFVFMPQQNTPNTNSSFNKQRGLDIMIPSPVLNPNTVNFSPNLFGQNQILSLMKNQFSPNLFNDNMFDRSYFQDAQWTPETSNRQLNLTDSSKMKPNNLLWGQNRSPEQKGFAINNSALLTRGPQTSPQSYLQAAAGYTRYQGQAQQNRMG